ncbi:uncharacterized protein LOC112591662 [Melanaphis sacchari]|uniref:uncharacterized protein LOC112591662 n=1 Tax=Melanaphis sacchari TaxID=742174 RepID=UPI000DC14792|nr:uncharacterized protein LOC112591662 [Melanaphis sacchari]
MANNEEAENVSCPQTILTMSRSIGTAPEFKPGEDWNLYIERLDQFFIANFVEDCRKVSVLITVIGAETYKVLRELCDPILPNTLSYEQVCNTLKKQFSPKLAVFRERTKFYELKQSNNQSINEWYVYIKKAAMNCKFGSHLLEKLKDKFVTGLQKGPILDRLSI